MKSYKIKTKSYTAFFFILLLGICLMVIAPFLGIWSINTLFSVSIAYTWKNWCAFMLLLFILKLGISYGDSK
jgi:putative Mn2+ efflux pump MntP